MVDQQSCEAMKPKYPGIAMLNFIGGPQVVQCTNSPTVVIVEANRGKDNLHGAMSLCDDCLEVAKMQLTQGSFRIFATFPLIRDWEEDFDREDCSSSNLCKYCHNSFKGHEERIICKKCVLEQS